MCETQEHMDSGAHGQARISTFRGSTWTGTNQYIPTKYVAFRLIYRPVKSSHAQSAQTSCLR